MVSVSSHISLPQLFVFNIYFAVLSVAAFDVRDRFVIKNNGLCLVLHRRVISIILILSVFLSLPPPTLRSLYRPDVTALVDWA